MKNKIIAIIIFLIAVNAFSQYRSINSIFPNLNNQVIADIYSDSGYVKTSSHSGGFVIIGNRSGSGLERQIVNMVLQTNPRYLVESIKIIPVNAASISLLNIYNALGKVRDLKGRLYNSSTQGQLVPLF